MAIRNIGLTFTLIFEPFSDVVLDFQAKYDMQFTDLVIVLNTLSLAIYVNDVLVSNALTISSPIVVEANDTIRLEVGRDVSLRSKFELIGNSLN